MADKKLKKQEKVERFIISPSTHLFFGVTVKKDTDIEDEIVLPNGKGTIHQIIKNLVLTTIIKKKTNEYGIETVENSKLVQKLLENFILVWGEDTGYVIPPYRMKDVKEAIEDLEAIKDI